MKVNVTLDVEDIPLDDLAAALAQNLFHREELISFVKEVDRKMADWSFTLALCEHFELLKKEFEREMEEDRRGVEALFRKGKVT